MGGVVREGARDGQPPNWQRAEGQGAAGEGPAPRPLDQAVSVICGTGFAKRFGLPVLGSRIGSTEYWQT